MPTDDGRRISHSRNALRERQAAELRGRLLAVGVVVDRVGTDTEAGTITLSWADLSRLLDRAARGRAG